MLGGDWTDGTMTDFKWRHFQGDVILWAVRWYCRYQISYRDLAEMLAEGGGEKWCPERAAWAQRGGPEVGAALGGSVAKIVKLGHAWRRLDGRNDDRFQVAPFPG